MTLSDLADHEWDVVERAQDLDRRLREHRADVERQTRETGGMNSETAARHERLRVEAVAMYRELAIVAGHWNEGDPPS